MNPLVQLVGSVLSWLRPMVGANVCPGEWAWTITVFGLLVGLLPACGAVTVAVLRRRAERTGGLRRAPAVPVIAVLSCGLLPWLAFEATGQAFRRAGTSSTVFNRSGEISLAGRTCLGVSERAYLGSLPVSGALGDGMLRTALFAIPLVIFPGFAVLFVWIQGKLALRRGPRWPSRYFWLSTLAVAVLTGPMPAGTTAQLWTGVVGGAFAGVAMALLVPPPARAAATRAGAVAGPPPAGRPGWPAAPSAGAARPAPNPGPARPASYPGPARPASYPGPARPASYPGPARSAWSGGAARPLSRLPRPLSRLPRHWRVAAKQTSAACWAGLRDRCWPALRDWAARWLANTPDRMRARLAAAAPHPVIGFHRGDHPLATNPGPLPDQRMTNGRRTSTGPPAPKPTLPATLVAPPGGLGGRFELVHQIGTGGFGGVWLATDRVLGRRVAVKAAHAPDHQTELRIRREANALGAVRHPHCVRILDLVDSRGEPGLAPLHGLVIVMEYVDGRSLGEIVAARGPMDDTTAARVWLGMAEALTAAHQRGVLHRDVKPGNVLLDARGEPHLIDFGIARARGDATLTLHGMIVGTPDFMAPEVARGERATPASDGWQLAATISFALTGWPPRGDHPDAASGVRAAAGSAPLTCLPRHSVHLRLLEACLATDPAARPTLPTVRNMLHNWLLPTSGSPRVGPLTATLDRTGTD